MDWKKKIILVMVVAGANAAHAGPADAKSGCGRNAQVLSPGVAPTFIWPVQGELSMPSGHNPGIDIAGVDGAPVKAAANGVVAYAGDALPGYGRLIVVRHDDIFLTAYANNRKLLVNEGDRVCKGQVIAELGRNDAGRPTLHFEIRRNGDSVDPLTYLPARTTEKRPTDARSARPMRRGASLVSEAPGFDRGDS